VIPASTERETCTNCGRLVGYDDGAGYCAASLLHADTSDRQGCHLATIANLRAELAEANRRREHTEQWYAVRCERLWHWAHEDEEHRGEYFSIIANGTTSGFEPPSYAQQLNMAKYRAEKAEAELAAAKAEIIRLNEALDIADRELEEVR